MSILSGFPFFGVSIFQFLLGQSFKISTLTDRVPSITVISRWPIIYHSLMNILVRASFIGLLCEIIDDFSQE